MQQLYQSQERVNTKGESDVDQDRRSIEIKPSITVIEYE